MPTTLSNPLTIIGGTGVTASNSGVAWDGTTPINQSITVGNDISQSGNVQFNSVNNFFILFVFFQKNYYCIFGSLGLFTLLFYNKVYRVT